MVVYSILLVDLSPTFYCLPKPLLVYGSMLLLSTLITSSYDHVGDHVVSSPEGVILVTSPGTKSLYPRPPQSLNPSYSIIALVVMLGYDWGLRMVINISVQYNGGFLSDIILLTQSWLEYHVVCYPILSLMEFIMPLFLLFLYPSP